MAQRAMDVYRCKHCNAGARFIVLPLIHKFYEESMLFRNGTINGQFAECPVRENNHCTPPDIESFDMSLANDGLMNGEVQMLAALTGLKFDATCQRPIRDATLGCIFCLTALGRSILACAEPLIAKGEDFVVEPAWLQNEVHAFVRGSSYSLHKDEHKSIFGARPARKSLKKPRAPPKQPGISYMIPGGGTKKAKKKPAAPKPPKAPEKKRKCPNCGVQVEAKHWKKHEKVCVENVYSCTYCSKCGLCERGLRLHLLSCKGETRPPQLLPDSSELTHQVAEIVDSQNRIRAKRRAAAAKKAKGEHKEKKEKKEPKEEKIDDN